MKGIIRNLGLSFGGSDWQSVTFSIGVVVAGLAIASTIATLVERYVARRHKRREEDNMKENKTAQLGSSMPALVAFLIKEAAEGIDEKAARAQLVNRVRSALVEGFDLEEFMGAPNISKKEEEAHVAQQEQK